MYRVLKSISILYRIALLLWPLFCKAADSTILNGSSVFGQAQLQAFNIFDSDRPAQLTARSFLCLPFFRVFNVELRPDLQLAVDEFIAVSGDHPSLGAWNVAKALTLRAQNKQRTKWYLRRWICASHRVYYRYLIYTLNAAGERVLRRWEAQQVARMLQTYEIYRPPGVDVFGEAYPRSVGGGHSLERGWLQREYVIELKFVWQQHFLLAGLNLASPQQKLRLKLRPLGVLDNALIEVSRYAYNRSSFRPQGRQGVMYAPGTIVIFRISQALDVFNAFGLAIYEPDAEGQLPLGEAYILPEQLRGSRGLLQLAIQGQLTQQVIGQLTLPYMVVWPMPNAASSNLRVSFQRYWPNNWPTLDVGNRGLGISHQALVENTIESFLAVPRAKGDMVQLDVQLTRDYVPVVWRGFGFYTTRRANAQHVEDRFDLRYVLVRELSYAELKASRVFLLKRWTMQEYTHLNVRNVSQAQRLFPKLSEVYEALPKSLGLIVAVKWPQLMASGELESTQSLNKNVFVDRIIEVTARYGCGRPLIFASFDADICTMMRLKQTAFPVMLMTTGRTDSWDEYMDLRTQSFLQAINFAESAELLGTAAHVKNFQQKLKLVDLGLDLMQVVFVWGSDLQDVQQLELLRAIDVTGLIYDHIDRVGPGEWKRAPFFQAPQLLEVFGGQCVAIGNSSTVPGAKPTKPTVWPKMRK